MTLRSQNVTFYNLGIKKVARNLKWASDSEFHIIRKNVPFSCVDLVIILDGGFVLAKRENAPYKGSWHLPGGIIHKGQSMKNKAQEVAIREIGFPVEIVSFIGVFENMHRYRHDISHCYVAKPVNPNFPLKSGTRVFRRIPENIIPYHREVLVAAKKLLVKK